jgi:ribosomal protein L7/L12
MLLTIIAVVILFLALLVRSQLKKDKALAEIRSNLVAKHKTDETYVSTVDGNAIGFNFREKRLMLRSGGKDRSYPFSAIAAMQVIENGATLTQTNRGSQLAGAAIGGLALGGVGALIGGMSGSTRTQHNLRSVSIKVTVDDRFEPVHTICFLNVGGNGVEPDGIVAKPARAAAERVHAHLVNAMRQVQQAAARQLPPGAAADGLGKLWDMRQAGALTEDEFQAQKAMLLSAGSTTDALPASEPSGRQWRVILVHPGPHRSKFAKVLMEMVPELSDMNGVKLMGSLPAKILSGVDEERAREVQEALIAVGAEVEIA